MFLGGFQSPIGEEWIVSLPPVGEALIHTAIMVVKFLASIGLMMWIRWTLPRFRIDQVMKLAWTKLVPLALFCLFGLAVTQLLQSGRVGVHEVAYGRYLSAPVVHMDIVAVAVSWLILGGAIATVVALAKKYGETRPMSKDVQDALTGKEKIA